MKYKALIIIIICMLLAAPSYAFDYYRRYSFSITHGVNMPDAGLMQRSYGVICKYGITDKIQTKFVFESYDGKFETQYEGASVIKGTGSVIGVGAEYCFAEIIYLRISGAAQINAKILDLKNFTSEDILLAGHRLTKIKLKGQRITRNKTIPIELPVGTGSKEPVSRKRTTERDKMNLLLKDQETVVITRAFNKTSQFDAFRSFIFEKEEFKELTWFVEILGTENKTTNDACLWVREKVGDGTKRMALELMYLNGKHYTDCIRGDLITAADDLFDTPCHRIKLKKDKEFYKSVCMIAVEDGKVNIEGYTV